MLLSDENKANNDRICLLLQFAQRLRYRGRRVLEHVVAYAKHVVFDIGVPHHLGDVHGEREPVRRRRVLVELLDVLADEVPLVQGEELAGPGGHLEPPVDLQHPAGKESF